MNPCPPIIRHLIHQGRRRITRHWRHYHALHLTIALTAGCVAGPAVLVHLLPPTIAPPADTVPNAGPSVVPLPSGVPTDVPEPASVWVLGAGVAAVVLVRRVRGIGGTGVRA